MEQPTKNAKATVSIDETTPGGIVISVEYKQRRYNSHLTREEAIDLMKMLWNVLF